MSNDSPLNIEAQALRALKERKQAIEDQLTDVNKQISYKEGVTLPELMTAHGVSTFKCPGVGTVYLQNETDVSVLADNRPELHAFLREQGDGSLVTETVHPATLKSYVKEKLEASDVELPEFIKVTFRRVAKLRKA